MKTINRFFLTFILCAIAGISFAQDNMLYYMGSLPQSTHLNPARRTNYGTTIVLPGSNFGFSAQSLASFNEMFTKSEITGEYAMDYEKFLNSLEDGVNPMVFNASTELLGIYTKSKNGTFNLSLSTGINSFTGFEKDMIGMLAKGLGDEDYIGRPIEIAPVIDFMHYHKLMIGGSRKINDKLNIGVNFNLLMGQAAFSMNQASLKVRQGLASENYAISTESNASAYTAGYANTVDLTEGSVSADDFIDSFMEDPVGSAFSTSNMGFTVDLGATYQFTEKLFFEASVRNLGKQITFKKDLQKYSVELNDESLAFDGIDPAELTSGGELSFIDTDDLYSFENDGETGEFTIALPTTYMAGARYELTRTTTTGAMLSGTSYRDDFFTTFAMSIDQEVGDFIGLGFNYAINKFGHQVGTAVTVGLPGIKVYLATDNALAAVKALDAKTVNLRAGVTLNFGRKLESERSKTDRKARKKSQQSLILE
ncbi:DUF5723 family protein [Sediminitomix flava]|uniref:DUF5723 domain-containing protein n=1 Tax=Sediminitomix flava TaxID=379075 RepID=A0A315ZES6_SEDFL|nr:DUF5723 family protein [Sediminitomix flava]PWJ44065.1 hypothetical protein BC781_101415 [Sediminitomix flava]